VSQEAMDLNFDGLIVESHINPEKAWSDAAQQLTPDALKEMIDSIVLRKSKIVDVPRVTLDNLRTDIDALDNKLLELLKERMKISEAIGKYKLKNNITILQTRRYDEILTKRKTKAIEKGLSPDFVIDIFESIHEESIHCQNELMNKELKKKKQ
jgi:chorismate mutase